MEQYAVPPNAVVIHTTLTIQTGILSRTLDTTLLVQTAKWPEVVRAIEECWRITKQKALEDSTDAAAPVPPGKSVDPHAAG